MRPAVVALLLTMAVLAWPVRDRIGRAAAVLGAGSEAGGQSRHGGSAGQVARAVTRRGPVSLGGIWHQDPVEVFRRWRLRRKPDDVIASALALLDATEPALVAGLPPSTAIGLAVAAVETGGHDADGVDRASSLPEPGRPASRAGVLTPAIGRLATHVSRPGGSGRVSGARVTRPTTGRQLGVALADSARQGHSVAAVWADYADRTGSRDLAFVAAAWSLSEDTGVPLAVAVARAAAGLREARTRRRRVAVAVAGPKATVAVLTVLPLTGPLFGLACGVGPAELYGGHPIGAASAAAGFLLMVVGRFWCRRMIRRAVTP